MNLEQRFTVDLSHDVVWTAFHDPALLVECLPGATLTGAAEDGALPLQFKVRLGPIAAAFAGRGSLSLDEAGRTGVFGGQAVDGKSNSRVKGEARFRVMPEADATRVAVTVDVAISGSLAQFGREGILRALGDQLTRQFAQNLRERLADARAASTETAMPASGAAGAMAAEPEASAPSLNLLSLLAAMLRQGWRRLTHGREAS